MKGKANPQTREERCAERLIVCPRLGPGQFAVDAPEVEAVMPQAVVRGWDGFLRVL